MTMCANHPEALAVAYCRNCGKPLCELCRVENQGAVFCAEHAPVAQAFPGQAFPGQAFPGQAFPGQAKSAGFAPPPPLPFPPSPYNAPAPSPYTAPAPDSSPALAVLLGIVPGVGAIYNGQYAKGLIHAVIFGLIITVISGPGSSGFKAMMGILLAAWEFYMIIEAYHTARKRRDGIAVDEFSSMVNLRGTRTGVPLGAIVLIGLGVLLLLETSGLVSMDHILRYWPAALIVVGVYMLYARIEQRGAPVSNPELSDERR
jgi:hypothetical protein